MSEEKKQVAAQIAAMLVDNTADVVESAELLEAVLGEWKKQLAANKITALSVKTTVDVSPEVSPEVKEREDVFQQPLLSWVTFYKLLVSRNLATFGETNEVYRQRTEELYGVGVLKNLAPTPIISEADYHKLRITKEDALKQVLHGLPEIAGLLE